jgi:hypothetical protein
MILVCRVSVHADARLRVLYTRSIATHLACKWGKAVHDELVYLMPHRFGEGTSAIFLLHSSSHGSGGFTWGPNDRDVQASDVYTEFVQVCFAFRAVQENARALTWLCTNGIAIVQP